MHEPVTMPERYARATETSRLIVGVRRTSDADVLMATGWAAQKDPRRALAMRLFRLQVGRTREGLGEVLAGAEVMLMRKLSDGGRLVGINQVARRAVVADTIGHMLDPTCHYCNGLGHAVIEGTVSLSTQICLSCHGTGKRQLARAVPREHLKHAQWLEDELNRLTAVTFDAAKKLLAEK